MIRSIRSSPILSPENSAKVTGLGVEFRRLLGGTATSQNTKTTRAQRRLPVRRSNRRCSNDPRSARCSGGLPRMLRSPLHQHPVWSLADLGAQGVVPLIGGRSMPRLQLGRYTRGRSCALEHVHHVRFFSAPRPPRASFAAIHIASLLVVTVQCLGIPPRNAFSKSSKDSLPNRLQLPCV